MAGKALFCPYCGQTHEPHEDASCGCGCGSNPMECGNCYRLGGPTPRYNQKTGKRQDMTPPELLDPDLDFEFY